MNLTDPTTLLLIVVAILLGPQLWDLLMRGGKVKALGVELQGPDGQPKPPATPGKDAPALGPASTTPPSLDQRIQELERKITGNHRIMAETEARLESTEQNLETTMIKLREAERRIQAMETKDKLKRDFRERLAKLVSHVTLSLNDSLWQQFISKSTESPQILKSSDEWHALVHLIDDIGHQVTKRGMDDFDRNGFGTIGLKADGKYDHVAYTAYLRSKVSDYLSPAVGVVDSLLERPLTFTNTISKGVLCVSFTDRHTFLTHDEVSLVVRTVITNYGTEIEGIYEFVIDRYRALGGVES